MAKISNTPTFVTKPGYPEPYGTSLRAGGVNFVLFTKNGTSVTLCLWAPDNSDKLFEIPLDPKKNKTGNIWHIHVEGVATGWRYGYRINGPYNPQTGMFFDSTVILLDPYAKAIDSSHAWGEPHLLQGKKDSTDTTYRARGILLAQGEEKGDTTRKHSFDWQETARPEIRMENLVIYEMHVRGLTKHPSSKVTHPGTFLGLIEKIPYLKDLGVNAIELLPVHEFNECEFLRCHPVTKKTLYNYWGYSTVNFFAPMNRYSTGTSHTSAIDEFKIMVRELHKAGIEVILDVVFNHTAEGNENGPSLSFRGLENVVYYMLAPDGQYLNFSGCGNTLNCNHPVVRMLILNCLRYWVTEMHVDGFRFDLASILGRATDGTPLPTPPLIEMITLDPLFANTKLIAEAWDAGGLYQVGSFPSWGIWAEWNGKYRDNVRRFIKGTPGEAGHFATRLCGSEDLYGNNRSPWHSVNFVTCHDGFTLADTVAYNEKHNESNGENNQDGLNQNDTWNCGAEGKTKDPKILALRQRQMRNFHLALMVSQGIPMLHMGDEYAHTKYGNNNSYCHDSELNWFLWDRLADAEKGFFRFYKLMIAFRIKHIILRRSEFLQDADICWHGILPGKPDWSQESKFVAYTLKDHESGYDLYIAFNADHEVAAVSLPELASGLCWHRIVNTALLAPEDIVEEADAKPVANNAYRIAPYSAVLLKALNPAMLKEQV